MMHPYRKVIFEDTINRSRRSGEYDFGGPLQCSQNQGHQTDDEKPAGPVFHIGKSLALPMSYVQWNRSTSLRITGCVHALVFDGTPLH